jgi:2-polyprenyl-3-methyl-5-hydroxy-6-metoxy-1,4-benzoquinol methylase
VILAAIAGVTRNDEWTRQKLYQMRMNEGIQVEEANSCLLCRARGVPRYQEMRDRLFGAAGVWSISYCPDCDFSWLNPRPVRSDIAKLYETYYTHNLTNGRRSTLSSLKHKVEQRLLKAEFGYDSLPGGTGTRLAGRLLGTMLPMAREITGSSVMWLNAQPHGKLLDVGCGNGSFLATMQELGWEVSGVEPDTKSANIARERLSVAVTVGTLEESRFLSDSFDCITAHQTIEHMLDPIAFLAESFRILRPGGRLVVTTPNIASFGHLVFRRCWRGLEPPRHLHLFSTRALGICAGRVGYQIETLRTTARSTWEIWYASRLIRRDGKIPSCFPGKLNARLCFEGLAFQLFQHVLLRLNRNIGEQIVMMASKPAR